MIKIESLLIIKGIKYQRRKSMVNSGTAIKFIYPVEDRPQVGETILLGFQNVITSFGGLVAVPILIG